VVLVLRHGEAASHAVCCSMELQIPSRCSVANPASAQQLGKEQHHTAVEPVFTNVENKEYLSQHMLLVLSQCSG
jgi:hypothetical protein